MAKFKPRIVASTHRPVDITALIRADIDKRDWDAVQIAGDKRQPVDLGETRKGGWLR